MSNFIRPMSNKVRTNSLCQVKGKQFMRHKASNFQQRLRPNKLETRTSNVSGAVKPVLNDKDTNEKEVEWLHKAA